MQKRGFWGKKTPKTSKHVTFTSYQFKVGKEAKSLLLFLMLLLQQVTPVVKGCSLGFEVGCNRK